MRNSLIFAFFSFNKTLKDVGLTFIMKNCNILDAGKKNICFKTNQKAKVEVEEECLKSKMELVKKYDLNITMTVFQIKTLRKYIICWSQVRIPRLRVPLAFYHYLPLQSKLNLEMEMGMAIAIEKVTVIFKKRGKLK
jgi:hypothetical protein